MSQAYYKIRHLEIERALSGHVERYAVQYDCTSEILILIPAVPAGRCWIAA